MAQAKILVVDDEAGIRDSLRGVLEDEGFQVLTAEDGSQGLEQALAERPEVILLDIWLPGMDGLECLRQIRAELPETQVIMISGHGTVETAVKATKLGAYDFIEKPLALEQVLLRIRHALEARRMTHQRDAMKGDLDTARSAFERTLVVARLEEHQGDPDAAAESLGLAPEELRGLMADLGLS